MSRKVTFFLLKKWKPNLGSVGDSNLANYITLYGRECVTSNLNLNKEIKDVSSLLYSHVILKELFW